MCVACPNLSTGWCASLADVMAKGHRALPAQLNPVRHSVPARRIVCREGDCHDWVPVICSGWAAASVTLTNGRKQILAFLLPGDIVSTTLVFEANYPSVIEAITTVEYCSYPRDEIKNHMFRNPKRVEVLASSWIDEKRAADQLAIDLGRRTAHERIARLIESLRQRLAPRDTTMEFPLRQHHIADATGLTPVHVSKVLSEFRRNGLIEISDRSITILNPTKFNRIASLS